ncbi:RelE family Toxin-antitoxin system [ [[Clostridium] symbiosum WAL-14163]|jgi:toxin-antitoxin system, toxin component, relE family|uniref:RelE family Toxin-antitoxin system n=2 Tax=Lachnospiraceae TaxID=186803 RepID=E7GL92_CLOS6|nr:RelE family Toxin-antitoxin system [ [[Clostridium] symbiosum WAL-14163]
MQKEGILPPDKARLNRKKFAREVMAEFGEMDVFAADLYLRRAIGCMVSEDMPRVSEEQVGVLKLLKIAVETQKFMKALEAEGRTQYTIGEYVDKVVLPIRSL